jgi:hypothetical protein
MGTNRLFLRGLEVAYIALVIVTWPVTVLISTAFALKLKVPPLRWRIARVLLRPRTADS